MSTFRNSILVTGDVVADTDIYLGERSAASVSPVNGTVVKIAPGGAALLHEILRQFAASIAGSAPEVEFGFQENDPSALPPHLRAQALYRLQPGGFIADKKAPRVWRVTEGLGYGAGAADAQEPSLTAIKVTTPPRVLVLDDGGAGFRREAAKPRWPFAPEQSGPPADWIVLKMAKPVAQGDLWRAVSGQFAVNKGKQQGMHDRLVAVVNAEFLRHEDAGISRGLSWEKTVSEICGELASNAVLRALLNCRHVVILFRHEGALWIDTEKSPAERAQLIFAPDRCEAEWATTLADPIGEVYGHLTVFTAFVALELALRPKFDGAEFKAALKAGLEATRLLRLLGHREATASAGFPFEPLAKLAGQHFTNDADNRPKTEFASATVPCEPESLVPDAGWTIIANRDTPGPSRYPLFGTALLTALKGPKILSAVPHAQFGKYISIDREEIETLRALRQSIRRYVNDSSQRKPLAIAVFGPPGAGKSFGLKQIAEEVFQKKPSLLEFNLSQFTSSEDLVDALHQVRDKVLEGDVPLAFWDEFDSGEYRWLQYFLAPLQDGKFQQGQITHAISRCIFVFAGGTSWDFEHFGPAPEPRDDEQRHALAMRYKDNDEGKEQDERRRAEFILKKGPDFLSRLDSHLNILGPNRRHNYNFSTARWDIPDSKDVGFPIRRALLLRSQLELKEDQPLRIERSLLTALLRVPRYRHGARSMEKIVLPMKGPPGEPLRRANLPPAGDLDRHLETVRDFKRLLDETRAYRADDNLRRIAAAVHEHYLRTVKHEPPNSDFNKAFDELDPWGKATNIAAAARLPDVLALAGLRLVPSQLSGQEETRVAQAQIEHHIEVLAEAEHDMWIQFLADNDWRPFQQRDNQRLLHNRMVAYADLPDSEKTKDRATVLAYPEMARLAGYKIAFIDDQIFSPAPEGTGK
jgi:hypothetical protein